MPAKVPQPHNQKKKGKSLQERRAEKRMRKAGGAASGLRIGTDRNPSAGAPRPQPPSGT